MCRLYGFRANEETKVECSLVHAQNALMVQSRGDARGMAHPDGWGIATYDADQPSIDRRIAAAFKDVHFSVASERIYSHTVIAHVRKATVGDTNLSNTHPFSYGVWTFAHNGTVTAFDRVSAQITSQVDKDLLAMRHGTTDSELIFYWLLSQLRRGGLNLDSQNAKQAEIIPPAMIESVQTLSTWCEAAGADQEPRLNLLLSDGHWLFATRWNNTLSCLLRPDIHDCEICGIPHVRHDTSIKYRAAVVASEPITHESWQDVPDPGFVSISPQIEMETRPV